VSGDQYNGDPQIEVFVDGQQVGGTYTVTADHASGQTQTITITGNFDPTVAHQVQVEFVNDAWDGTSWWSNGSGADGHDRNVYVESISLNGETLNGSQGTDAAYNGVIPQTNANEAVMSNDGTLTFNVSADPPATTSTATTGTSGSSTDAGGSSAAATGTSGSSTDPSGSTGATSSSTDPSSTTSTSTSTDPTTSTTSTGASDPAQTTNAFYVSPNGNDSNAGTLAAPFATLARAQQAMEGSSIKTTYVEGGTYNLSNTLTLTSADNGETWQYYAPDGVDSAIIDGGGTLYNIVDVFAQNVTIDGLQFQHATNSGVELDGPNHNGGYVSNNNTVENCVFANFTNVDGAPIAIWGATNTKVYNNLIYNVTSKAIGVETWAGDNSSGTDIENNVIINAVTNNTDNGAIYLQDLTGGNTTDVTIKNNFIDGYGSAANFDKAIYLDDGASNTTITGNIIEGSGEYAIQYHGGDNNVVSGNIIDLGSSGNQYVAIYQSDGLTNMSGNTFTGNIILNSGSSVEPAWYDLTGGATPPTVANNVYYNSSGGPTSDSGGNITDSSPVYENPEISGSTYAIAAGSPVFSGSVNFPTITGGWGPPGYNISQGENA
jgi:parallel beta-helix repeat protein